MQRTQIKTNHQLKVKPTMHTRPRAWQQEGAGGKWPVTKHRQAGRPPQTTASTETGSGWGWGGGGEEEGLVDADVGSSLLLLGEFHRVAEDLDSLLLMTGSTCRGRLTVEAEHLPAPERTQHRQLFTWGGARTPGPPPARVRIPQPCFSHSGLCCGSWDGS